MAAALISASASLPGLEIREARSEKDFSLTLPLLEDLASGDPELTPRGMIKSFHLAIDHGYRHFCAAFGNGDVVGVAGLYPTYNPTFSAPGFELSNLVVRKDLRGRGIGKALIAYCEAFAQENGAGFLRLFVHPGNDDAVRLYLNRGYKYGSSLMWKAL